jgi:hypothetical protein
MQILGRLGFWDLWCILVFPFSHDLMIDRLAPAPWERNHPWESNGYSKLSLPSLQCG